eukprot:Rhum_TRINITY_DN14795_c30_g1::Rhum_TRINITY_DN14795_c30_g1_i1::g.118382::m.118382
MTHVNPYGGGGGSGVGSLGGGSNDVVYGVSPHGARSPRTGTRRPSNASGDTLGCKSVGARSKCSTTRNAGAAPYSVSPVSPVGILGAAGSMGGASKGGFAKPPPSSTSAEIASSFVRVSGLPPATQQPPQAASPPPHATAAPSSASGRGGSDAPAATSASGNAAGGGQPASPTQPRQQPQEKRQQQKKKQHKRRKGESKASPRSDHALSVNPQEVAGRYFGSSAAGTEPEAPGCTCGAGSEARDCVCRGGGRFVDQGGRWVKRKPTQVERIRQVQACLPFSGASDAVLHIACSSAIPTTVITPSHPAWVPDQARTTCTFCTRTFHIFFRRHHCRGCGAILCSACTTRASGTALPPRWQNARLCATCNSSLLLFSASSLRPPA